MTKMNGRPRRATRPHLDSILTRLLRAHIERATARTRGQSTGPAEEKIRSLSKEALLQGLTPIELKIKLEEMSEQTAGMFGTTTKNGSTMTKRTSRRTGGRDMRAEDAMAREDSRPMTAKEIADLRAYLDHPPERDRAAEAAHRAENIKRLNARDYPRPRPATANGATVKKNPIDAVDAALLKQVDRLIDEGGGWANWKRLPGGDEWVQRMVDEGVFEEEDGFVRRTGKVLGQNTKKRTSKRAGLCAECGAPTNEWHQRWCKTGAAGDMFPTPRGTAAKVRARASREAREKVKPNMDRRDLMAMIKAFPEGAEIDEERLTITFMLDPDEGEPLDCTFRFKFDVCDTCGGKGKHVNPSIDSHGISPEEFDEDPDFKESYFSGAYDVTCAECGGQRVVPVIDETRADPKCLAAYREWQEEQWAYAREVDAERRSGA